MIKNPRISNAANTKIPTRTWLIERLLLLFGIIGLSSEGRKRPVLLLTSNKAVNIRIVRHTELLVLTAKYNLTLF